MRIKQNDWKIENETNNRNLDSIVSMSMDTFMEKTIEKLNIGSKKKTILRWIFSGTVFHEFCLQCKGGVLRGDFVEGVDVLLSSVVD